MPTLHWIGKEKVINHHQEVPYKILKEEYTYKDGKEVKDVTSQNKIIQGDNLEALKSLLPEYEGRIKCIYIDPPYNTGNEGWVYNDNVNDPKIKKWLHQVVGKEGEDLSRHDKWLCMMYPRLKLLHKLLANDGAIFISIDDNEFNNLKLVCDEIFGNSNFITNFIWQKRKGGGNDSYFTATDHEYICCYVKSKTKQTYKWRVPYEKEYLKRYNKEDDKGRFYWDTLSRAGLNNPIIYDVECPDGTIIKDGTWQISKTTFDELLKVGEVGFIKNKKGVYNVVRKVRIPEGKVFRSIITNTTNKDAADEMERIFNNKKEFSTPKPCNLIEQILTLIGDRSSIVLDSFAGSGTTAHAVLNLNKQDGGNRKFILVEMEEYANTITAERVKRVIKGYGEDKKVVEGTGGDFTYYTLGEPIFLENDFLNESIDIEKIKEYIWYTETRKKYLQQAEEYLMGKTEGTAYYFYYEKDGLTTLDNNFLRSLKTKAEQYIIYADNCLLDEELMSKYHIVFKKIPRDITRF
ncbi:site-specific DNA-methyltransferase [Flavobacterium rakeshii]|uniref:site-specific DNA-methyltransferase n=1 Tax=Flavobacterium rakeshii TaxID=1038845 RepID=UPI002E7B0104|nr:site-specific DNA-methyltransferase [Flavobacterium rakeshii]MEE1897976.1 site-specific DNA-methyltransferase [Flavobacterium rakeshii]